MSDVLITGDGQFPMDVRVPILSAQTTKEGRTLIVVQGEHRGRTVGVEISIRGQMKPGIVGDDIDKAAFYGSGILVRSIGDRTKNLTDVFPRCTSSRLVLENRLNILISLALRLMATRH
jgi:hypothetical protein